VISHISARQLHRERILINCPRCGAQAMEATCADVQETYNLIIRHTNTWVTCHACGTKLFAKARCEELVGLSPEELEPWVIWRISLIRRVLALAALVLCIMPMIGTVIGLVATAANWRNGGGWKKVSVIALCISFVPLMIYALVFVLYIFRDSF
jgi:DNA-directed RNA polymerase subunit RPC12/RpoP